MGLECMLKADASTVPQVLQTARQLLLRQRVPALQLELTKTNKQSDQTCAAIKMLKKEKQELTTEVAWRCAHADLAT